MNIAKNKILIGDKTIIIAVIVLMLFSALLMGSISPRLAIQSNNLTFTHLIKQLSLSVLALIIMIYAARIPYKIYFKISKYILIATLILLAITLIFGKSINNTKRWLIIPFINMSIQTTDIVRVGLIIHITKIISEYNANKDNLKKMFKQIMYWTIPIILAILYINISTGIIVAITIFTILYITPINKKYFIKMVGIGVLIIGLALVLQHSIKIGRGKIISSRIIGNNDIQKTQALIAVSHAKLLPHPGSSKQKFLLSNAESDFVFSIIIEEYGILGIIIVLGLYAIIAYRVGTIIRQQKRTFPIYLTIGLSINIIIQTIVHLFVSTGIGPVTGQPLPLISMGGTSTIITAFQISIILNISTQAKQKPEKEIQNSNPNTEETEIKDYLVG